MHGIMARRFLTEGKDEKFKAAQASALPGTSHMHVHFMCEHICALFASLEHVRTHMHTYSC